MSSTKTTKKESFGGTRLVTSRRRFTLNKEEQKCDKITESNFEVGGSRWFATTTQNNYINL